MAEEEEIAVEMDGAVSGWRMNGRAGGRSAGYRISSRGGRDGGMSNDLFMHQISFIAILFLVDICRDTARNNPLPLPAAACSSSPPSSAAGHQ